LNNVTYNGIGQVTGTTLGNGVGESYGYDANRMQFSSQTATQSGGSTGGLMNLTYSYQAAAGQTGAGSTAGNAGQLMTIGGTIGGVTESAGYSYDDLGRLVTSNQTSNTASAQRRFAYDRWGNRTGVWDATSGGNQIQVITLQQSGGAPTNRIASVTSSTTVNYTYDASGNVTNDGVHAYQYDAENRVASIDGGATASSSYDQQNRRYKKTVGSSVTHYLWQGSQILAEHNGSTGAVLIDYVYSGSRMIAKVASGTTQYLLSDRLSERLVLDTNGNVLGRQAHLPFGEDFGESGSQEKHHFTKYERDTDSGTDYALNRQFAQGVGRFMRVDYEAGSTANPQNLSRYSYSGDDPVNRVDPLGLEWECVCGHLPGEESVHAGDVGMELSGALECDCIWAQEGGGREGGQRTCPVAPLTPISGPDAQAFEADGNRVDTTHLTRDMQTAVACFQQAIEAGGGTLTITSAWRPLAYQQHLREVWDKHMALRNNNQPECRQTKAQVDREFESHGLIANVGARPAAHSDHTQGIAIDANIRGLPAGINVDEIGAACALRRTVQGDPVHWALRP
jgi:RHS repeat-associated protein